MPEKERRRRNELALQAFRDFDPFGRRKPPPDDEPSENRTARQTRTFHLAGRHYASSFSLVIVTVAVKLERKGPWTSPGAYFRA